MISEDILILPGEFLLKSAIAIGLGFLLAWLMGKVEVTRRHQTWITVFGVSLGIAVVLLFPRWECLVRVKASWIVISDCIHIIFTSQYLNLKIVTMQLYVLAPWVQVMPLLIV